MKKRTVFFAVLPLVIVVFSAYLLNDAVPQGITEPGKYRVFMAFGRLIKILTRIAHFAHRDGPYETYYVKSLRRIQETVLPTPPAEVEGSNIRSRVAEFDQVTVRLYEPINKKNAALIPAFIFIHGGGMCMGSADSYDRTTRKVAEELEAVVVSINYRLAPEHPFPSGFEDCLAATQHFMHHAIDFRVDQRRIGIGGDSAGGHLSASVAQAIHEDPNLPDLKLQVLVYPSVQKIDLNTPSYQKYRADFGDGGILPVSLIATFESLSTLGKYSEHYVSQLVKNNHTSSEFKKTSLQYEYVDHEQIPADFRDPRYYKTRNDVISGDDTLWGHISHHLLDARSAPLFHRDVSGLPPAYIVTVGYDALRDDGIFYKNRLEKEGVPVTWAHYEEGFHGILSLHEFQLAGRIFNDIIAFVRNNI